jgi:hypothetical protein
MSRCAMPSRSDRPRRAGSQAGSSLIAAVMLTAIMALTVVVSLAWARSSESHSGHEGRESVAVQAADAGVNQYISRLVEDPRYYDHFVDPAEDPRIDPGGAVHPPGSPWTPGTRWTYGSSPETWTEIQDARFGRARYSLRITPPDVGEEVVTVQSTAEVSLDGARGVRRSIQSQIYPTSIADFQMISNKSIVYGTTARTTGKLYSAEDIRHNGTATAPAYAQQFACTGVGGPNCPNSNPSPSVYQGGAYDRATMPSFRDKFPTPIDFGQFTVARLDLKDAAANGGGVYRDDPAAEGWMIQFQADGTMRIWKVLEVQGSDIGRAITRLACPETLPVPDNGAVYFEQSVVVSDGSSLADDCGGTGPRPSVVNGRVTVGTSSETNIYIGGNTAYAADGDDVLGLISGNEIIVASYVPTVLEWRAASLAQSGKWRTYRASPRSIDPHQRMHYIGAQATYDGGFASMFQEREYEYDETLQRLRPPFYPVLEGAWSTKYWREVAPPGT